MTVGDGDALQVGRLPAEPANRLEHEAGVGLEQRVDEAQRVAVLDQERVHVAALGVAEAVDARSELGHALARGHGANGLSTPRSAGSSSGKWRSRSVRIELSSTQSMPSFV